MMRNEIRKLQSHRVLFSIVSDVLLPELAHIVEDYALRCEGHSVSYCVPGAKDIPVGRNTTVYYDGQQVFYCVHSHTDHIGYRWKHWVTINGYNLLGQSVSNYITTLAPPRIYRVFGDILITIQDNYSLLAEDTQGRQHWIHIKEYSQWKERKCCHDGVWIVKRENGVLVHFWRWFTDLPLEIRVPELFNILICDIQAVGRDTLFIKGSPWIRHDGGMFKMTLCENKTTYTWESIPVPNSTSLSSSTFTLDSGYITPHSPSVTSFMSRHFWVPEDYEAGSHELIRVVPEGIKSHLVDSQNGLLMIQSRDTLKVYF
jgi:hypothetical protein